jgi:hypothetical protein
MGLSIKRQNICNGFNVALNPQKLHRYIVKFSATLFMEKVLLKTGSRKGRKYFSNGIRLQ